MRIFLKVLLIFTLISSPALLAQKNSGPKDNDKINSALIDGLKFRAIGPALTSGRISDLAVNPKDRSHYYAAVASGGVWKTNNAGTTWTPVFDNEGSYSIGCITIDPNNPSTVWVGTGENNSQRSVAYGDGIYRSDDGGKSWKNMGLKKSEHIGKIIVDPRNSDVVYVAAQGPLWNAGGDRGLYKTIDGGATWKAILSISENTGVNEVVFDPHNPDIIYASSYQRRRHVFTLIDGGPETAIYKSTDAGQTWNKLTSGLPSSDMGKIGLAVSPVNPDLVYAVIEAAPDKGGFFRSTDKGTTWEKRSGYFSGSAQYYNEIYCDPKDPERVYAMDTWLMVTDDGGKNFHGLGEKSKHVDNHAMWIDPNNTDYYLVGCDGGLYESFDRGANWNYKSNLPVTQFYRVAVDNSFPFYYVYGGTQDNFSLGGPSATVSSSGILNSDWIVTTGGDGFVSRVDPEDPNTVYSESQYGGLVRYNKKTGEAMGIKPQEGKGEEPLRWNWDSPLIISPFSHSRLYFAANKLFRSDDKGNTWKAISSDLTRKIDRNTLPVMGKVWGPDAVAKNASTSFYGNIVALAESPKKEGLIFTGTDDGLINVTEDGGGSWRKIEKFPGVPDLSYVSYLTASQHDASTVYAAFDNHKEGDFNPYLLKSNDAGKSWKSIKGNLPERGTVYSIAEDYINPDMLFAGTEFGVFYTVDGGQNWIQLKSGLPTIAVRDIAIQKRENDLVLATFGRGFYILDNYAPLREVNADIFKSAAKIFPVKPASVFMQSYPLGMNGKAFQGEALFSAENPAYGAVFTYYVKESVKTKKQLRLEAEKEALKKGEKINYPSNEELRAEDQEEEPYLLFTITDGLGNAVRKLRAPVSSGVKRIVWDLRYPSTAPVRMTPREEDEPFSEGESGTLALPGNYKISLSRSVNGVITELAAPVDFKIIPLDEGTVSNEDRTALADFQKKGAELRRNVLGLSEAISELASKLKVIKQTLKATPSAPLQLSADLKTMEAEVKSINRALNGDNDLRKRNENTPPSVSERVENMLGDQWQTIQAPTQTQKDAYRIASEEYIPLLERYKKLLTVDLVKIEASLDQLKAPYTPGRIPELKEK